MISLQIDSMKPKHFVVLRTVNVCLVHMYSIYSPVFVCR